MSTLSVIIIAQNEEKNIAQALDSAKTANEILVVDSGSTDKTVAIAEGKSAIVIHHPWQGYGNQKNVGRDAASSEWLFFLDADEVIPSELMQEIREQISQPSHDFYWIKIVTFFLNKPLKHLYGHNPRLFRKTAGAWDNAVVHEQVVRIDGTHIKLGDSNSSVLSNALLHYSHPTLRSYITRMHHYTTLDAKQMHLTHKHRSGKAIVRNALLPYHLAFRQFIKLYFYRKGILDGYAGLVWSVMSSYYEFEMAQKYLALSR